MGDLKKLGLNVANAGVSSLFGGLNTGLQFLFNRLDKEDEKQWWYEQQRYLEEHNSPAYRSMQMKQAGLNPFTEVTSTPLGNVDSSLPRMNSPHTFDVNAIQNALLLNAQRENIEQETKTQQSQQGLNESKIETESEWRSNLIQQTLNLKQEFELGLITREDAYLRLQEYKDALSQGYNSYLIDQDLKESNRLLNESLAILRKKEGYKVDQETLLTSAKYAIATFELQLDKIYSSMERSAKLQGLNIENAWNKAQFDEWISLQETRQSLYNIELSLKELAKDEATRQDVLHRITNEKDRLMAQSMLDALKDGDTLEYFMLNTIEKDPGSAMHSLSNIFNNLSNSIVSLSPMSQFNRASSQVLSLIK